MTRLSFCTDEHVPQAFVTALESNGFDVVGATAELGQNTVDEELLRWCGAAGRTLVTNDRDFVTLDREVDHAGLLLYTTQTLVPGEFVRGVRRIDRQFGPAEIRNAVTWLEQWL